MTLLTQEAINYRGYFDDKLSSKDTLEKLAAWADIARSGLIDAQLRLDKEAQSYGAQQSNDRLFSRDANKFAALSRAIADLKSA